MLEKHSMVARPSNLDLSHVKNDESGSWVVFRTLCFVKMDDYWHSFILWANDFSAGENVTEILSQIRLDVCNLSIDIQNIPMIF